MKLEIYPTPGKPSSPPTWEDIERLARHYVVVHRAVSLVRRGELTREEALIHVAFALAGAFQQLFQGEVERKMMEVAPMIIVKPPSSPAEVSQWEEESQAIIANLRAALAEARSERQREHELRVRFQGDAGRFEHHWLTTVAACDKARAELSAAQERIKTLVAYTKD